MLSKIVNSYKTFLSLIFLYYLTAFFHFLHHNTVLESFKVAKKYPWEILVLSVILTLVSLQSLLCLKRKSRITVLYHALVSSIVFLLLLFPITAKVNHLYLYPKSYVELEGKIVALKEIEFQKEKFACRIFVKEKNQKVEKTISFNDPLISKLGFIWIKNLKVINRIPVVQLEFMEFNPVPFLLLITTLTFLLFTPFVLYFK